MVADTSSPHRFIPHDRYLNRELSWLAFNERVLAEADNKIHPLFERLRFLAISGSNLDEFYMVRVAGLKAQQRRNIQSRSDDGMTAAQQLESIYVRVGELLQGQQACWMRLSAELAEQRVMLLQSRDLDPSALSWLKDYFKESIYPLLTPIAVDPAHPFPFLPNLGTALALTLHHKDANRAVQAIVPLPGQVKRLVRLPDSAGQLRYLLLENIVLHFIDQLFPDFTVEYAGVFRVIRDSEVEIDERAADLVLTFETALKQRKRGSVIRLGVAAGMPEPLRHFLCEKLSVEDQDIFVQEGIVGLTDVRQMITSERPDLVYKPLLARFPERIRDYNGDCFAAINAKDIVVHHPYESFEVVVQFLQQAAEDPDVVAIKQTLYRTSDDSAIVAALIRAAEMGKSVTALVELKARFDEEANIRWARDLERAGAQVIYGFVDLKTHAKMSLVVRREQDSLKTYVHYGTGNYHPLNARLYTDLSFFTSDPQIGRDTAAIFNYITGYATPQALEKVSIAPLMLRDRLKNDIADEIANAKAGRPAQIWIKLNSLVDREMIDCLYEASQAGVQIDLVVRGMCCLRPGVPGLSDNIRVRSLIGRFLEHSRIMAFGNGYGLPHEKAKVYISSADWMSRNFDTRIEALLPIENATVHQQILDQIMVAFLKDDVSAWALDAEGNYARIATEEGFSAHAYFTDNPSLSGRGSALLLERKPPKLEFTRFGINWPFSWQAMEKLVKDETSADG